MKNNMIRVLTVIIMFFLLIIKIDAIVISDGNNPGSGSATSGGASGGTVWSNPFAKSIRFRVFRSDGTRVNLGGVEYYSIADSPDKCHNQVTATICETAGYDYSTLIYNTYSSAQNNASTCSLKSITLGCLAAGGLNDTFKLGAQLTFT